MPALSRKWLRRLGISAGGVTVFLALAWSGLEWADRAYQPPVVSTLPISTSTE